jgi:predicted deacylase
MKIGTLEARPGQKVFGFFAPLETHGRFPVHLPLHIVRGSRAGPTLLVQAGVSGLEIEPAMELPRVVADLDPREVAGTLLLVPLLNTSGFEFEQVNAVWDDRDLNAVGRGRPDGSVSEVLIHRYYEEAVAKADAVLDIHTGARWGYFRYAGLYRAGPVNASRALAVALGLPQVVIGQPEDHSLAFEAARDGKAVVSAWIGGGPGLRDFREEDMRRVRRAVLNAMRHLGMLPGRPENDGRRVAVLELHTVLRRTGERGLTFIDKGKRGRPVRAGEPLGYVEHPFTGDVLETILAPRDGIMVHAGAAWPMLPEGALLAMLGSLVEEVTLDAAS